MDKHEKKTIYSCENILKKGPKKVLWPLLVL